jgi:WXG100 family type VII secretion target
MAFEGMDVDQVTSILTRLHSLDTQLTSVIQGMNQEISALESAWQGPDAKQFAAQWPSHQTALTQAANALQDIITHTQANLSQQQQTSGSYA